MVLKKYFTSFSKLFSDESLTKKASLNVLVGVFDYGARIVVEFVLTPLLVAELGDYLYGAWRVLWRLSGYLIAAGGRSAQALKWTLSNRQSSTNYEEKRSYVGSAVVVWLLLLPLLVTIGGLLAWVTPSLLNAPVEFIWSIRLAAGLLVVNVIVLSLADVPQSVLQGENLGYKRLGLSAVLVFVGGGLTALVLYFNMGLIGVALANLATTILTGALFLQVVRAYVSWFGIAKPSFENVRWFFGLSWWFLVWRIVIQVIMASDVVVLGVLDSTELVTAYSITKYASVALIGLVAIVTFGISPGLGGIIGAGNLQKAISIRGEVIAFTWLAATILGTTIVTWNRSFIRLWVGEKYYVGSIDNLLIVLMATQLVLIRADANIIDLTLDLRSKVLFGTLSATLSLVIAGILVGYIKAGITGLCLGFIAGRSILSLVYPWLIGRFLGIPIFSQLKDSVRPACAFVLLSILALILGESLTVSTWFGLFLSVGATLVVMSLLAFFTGQSGNQRRSILRRIQMMLPAVF